ncbi:hypothetical protein HY643_04000 [Candidatus Woesearchaeota archaeon]|nr:hypothetical protein [Candidatus Woesearchaeota archaeon]
MVDSLIASFKDADINPDKLLFIDGVTQSVNSQQKKIHNCIYVSSSSNLTDLSITIKSAFKTGRFDGLLFDSLSTLLIDNHNETVCKFTHDLINKIRLSNTTAVFTALKGDISSQLLKDVSMFVDEVVECEAKVTPESLMEAGLIKKEEIKKIKR